MKELSEVKCTGEIIFKAAMINIDSEDKRPGG
jgi:hypothetical protein